MRSVRGMATGLDITETNGMSGCSRVGYDEHKRESTNQKMSSSVHQTAGGLRRRRAGGEHLSRALYLYARESSRNLAMGGTVVTS